MSNDLQETSTVLEALQGLAPEIEARSEEIEERRAVSPDLVEKLRDAGLFRLIVPKSFGGEELNQLQACRVIEALAKADGAVGWTGFVVFGFMAAIGRYPRSVLEKIYASGPDVLMRGAIAPLGKAVRTEGGYLISGQWPFASGPYEPKWMMAGGIATADGKPIMGPDGSPKLCMCLVPGEQAHWLDTWYTVGLRGTNSTDFILKDVYVADDHVTNLFDLTTPCTYETAFLKLAFPLQVGVTHTAVVLGIAQGAIEELGILAKTKRGAFTPNVILGEDPIFKHKFGELATRVSVIRAILDTQCRENWELAQSGRAPTPLHLGRYGSQIAYCHAEAVDIVNQCFGLSGSYGVYSKSKLQRRWRDIRCAAQHFGVSPAVFQKYGGLLVAGGQAPSAHRHVAL